MLDIFLSIAPIFLLLVLGYGLRRGGIPSVEFWNLNDRLVYWILFPALLFSNTSTIDLSGDLLSSFAVVIYCGFGSAVLFALVSSRLFRLNGATASSVLQGAARHNSFIALAVAERLIGLDGLALATLVTALLIPVTNITVVTLMVTMIRGDGGRGARATAESPGMPSTCGAAFGGGRAGGGADQGGGRGAAAPLRHAGAPLRDLLPGPRKEVRAEGDPSEDRDDVQ